MAATSINFRFSQRFPFPVRRVYDWATDFQPDDIARMGMTGRRRVERLSEDTVLLTETLRTADGSRVVKKKLVRLYPERLRWTNTHTAGPNRHSQFLYELVPEGKDACRLEFTGRQLVHGRPLDPRARAELTRAVRTENAATWKTLARELAADLKGTGRRPLSRRASSRS